MTTYADTSVLVSAFTPDDHSPRANAWLETHPTVIVSNWTAAEFAAVIRRQARMRRLSRQGVEAAEWIMARLVNDPAAFRTVLAEDIVEARRLVRAHEPLRAPDALHLAIAIRLGAAMATFDDGLATAARAAGCDVVNL